MIDDSLKENEALGKRIGNNLKSFLKEQNSTYVPNLKEKIHEGLKEFYENLTNSINFDLHSQEQVQTNLMNQIDEVNTETEKLKQQQTRQRVLIEQIKLKKIDLRYKSKIFRLLKQNQQEETRDRKLESQLIYNRIFTMKKSIFKLLKTTTTFKSLKDYETEVKSKIDIDLRKYEETQIKQKEEILKLIFQAEDKLKHENRKKIQTKLLLDQIVLRGVSAMNLQALTLSNDALKGKLKIF